MNKKVIFSVAAAAALLVSNPVVNKADAASNCPTPEQVKAQAKVIYSQSGNLNIEQINNLLQKYMKNYNINLEDIQFNKMQALENAIKQQAPAKQPAKAQEPAKTPAKTQEQAKTPAKAQTPAKEPAKVQEPAKAPAQKPVQQQPAKAEQPASTPVSSAVSEFEQKVLELTNQERAKNGVPALQLDVELSKVAREKSRDMQSKGYFDHNSPTYGSPFDMMKQFGISYSSAGENIAMGQQSPEEVVNAWMNSEGHRKNILNASFTHLGVGHVANGNYWTQMFIGK